MSVTELFVEKICKAVRESDFDQLRDIIKFLVERGQQDSNVAQKLINGE